ncbi:carbohydrate ABC transporter permease [Haloferax sp. ATB1]|uniref:carbohydrate ABC transporter permease n=1 Tax=Haloferax sp. ATB1 TaxID=1508454 RepID=UPI00069458BF|nr:sugar ABC transporter permease [Haloferax sp. ATB1]
MSTVHKSEDHGGVYRVRNAISNFVNEHIVAVFLGPALLTIAAVFVYPVLQLIGQSFFVRQPMGLRFVGLENYVQLFSSSQFWNYFVTTLLYSFGSLVLSVLSGLALALAINHVRRKWLRNTYSTVILFAWAVPLGVIVVIFRFMLQGGNLGLLNQVLTDLGFGSLARAWLAQNQLALPLVTITDAWARMPFAMILFLAGLQSIPEYMYDATRVDGATTFQAFRHITIPYLRPYIAIVGLLNWMFAFRAFAVIYPMTQGGPGARTTTLSIYIYQEAMVRFNTGYGAAISTFLVLLTILVAIFYVKIVLQRIEE